MKKVLILFGGNSTEHIVSCRSAKSIIENIDKSIFDYQLVGISKDGKWYEFNDESFHLEKGNWQLAKVDKIVNIIDYLKTFDVIFPIIHGNFGEDGRLQGLLEMFNIKFVGCKTLASAIGMDKGVMKLIFDSINIPQVPYLIIDKNYEIEKIIDYLDYPIIIKPANGGSSIGISKASNNQELISGINEALKYDSKVILEKFIKARELEIAVLEDGDNLICSNPGEVISANEFYDYDAKYENKKSYTIIPAELPKEIVFKIKEIAINVFKKLNCKGYSRLDFFYDGNKIYMNEINTIPGFTAISMYPKLIENEGINYKNLITKLINSAI